MRDINGTKKKAELNCEGSAAHAQFTVRTCPSHLEVHFQAFLLLNNWIITSARRMSSSLGLYLLLHSVNVTA